MAEHTVGVKLLRILATHAGYKQIVQLFYSLQILSLVCLKLEALRGTLIGQQVGRISRACPSARSQARQVEESEVLWVEEWEGPRCAERQRMKINRQNPVGLAMADTVGGACTTRSFVTLRTSWPSVCRYFMTYRVCAKKKRHTVQQEV